MTTKQRGGKRAGAGSPPKYIGKTKKKLIPIAIEDEIDKLCEPYLNKRK